MLITLTLLWLMLAWPEEDRAILVKTLLKEVKNCEFLSWESTTTLKYMYLSDTTKLCPWRKNVWMMTCTLYMYVDHIHLSWLISRATCSSPPLSPPITMMLQYSTTCISIKTLSKKSNIVNFTVRESNNVEIFNQTIYHWKCITIVHETVQKQNHTVCQTVNYISY